MAKQRANLTSVGQFLGDTQQAYIKAPLVAAPFTSITDLSGVARKLPDPSQTLKPALGIERVMFRSVVLKQDETTALGQPVFEADSKDSRVRFVGNFVNVGAASGSYPQGQSINDFVEITFYGTGLNVLTILGGTTTDYRVSIDGGAEGTNVYPGGSSVLDARNYSSNSILNIASGLALGNHTVRIRRAVSTGYGLNIFGFEILNTSSSNIIIPKGSVIAAGQNATIAAQTSTAFNSGFDGNPTLNGRGGRVVVYATPEGRVGKVIQQVDNAELNLASANHTNEEVIRSINFREFGANRADDFSTLGASSNRAFTLDDGTTTLVAQSVAGDTAFTGRDAVAFTAGSGFVTITFVGTGLDLECQTLGTGTFSGLLALSINGAAEITFAPAIARTLRQKLVSGLPYGTNTVRLRLNTGANFTLSDFYIYGPKKPAIPDNAVQIAEYNLMADFVANSTAGVDRLATGILRKAVVREAQYIGAWDTYTVDATLLGGVNFGKSSGLSGNEDLIRVFWGTGLDFRCIVSTDRPSNVDVFLNGILVSTANFNINGTGTPTYGSITVSTYGGTTFTPGTGKVSFNGTPTGGAGFRISGLSLGLWSFRLDNNTSGAGNWTIAAFDIITPIHFPSNKVGSMSIGDLDLINKSAQKPVLDLSKAKAWVVYDAINQRILSSYNVSAVLRQAAGFSRIYFERPFKNANYVAVAGAGVSFTVAGTLSASSPKTANQIAIYNAVFSGVDTDAVFSLACFGELEGE
jgi:hypothetical protein